MSKAREILNNINEVSNPDRYVIAKHDIDNAAGNSSRPDIWNHPHGKGSFKKGEKAILILQVTSRGGNARRYLVIHPDNPEIYNYYPDKASVNLDFDIVGVLDKKYNIHNKPKDINGMTKEQMNKMLSHYRSIANLFDKGHEPEDVKDAILKLVDKLKQ